jgi:hypothetical protein
MMDICDDIQPFVSSPEPGFSAFAVLWQRPTELFHQRFESSQGKYRHHQGSSSLRMAKQYYPR